jgi:hypothetical protein
MNKKIGSEFAIGAILLLVIIVGGYFWLDSRNQMSRLENEDALLSANSIKPVQKNPAPASSGDEVKQTANVCETHYYEGKEQIRGWSVSDSSDNAGGIMVQISAEDIKKLPMGNSEEFVANGNEVKLIDPTEKVTKQLENASQENPAEIILQGFAMTCQQPPLVSIQPATTAFKKS